MVAYKRKEWAKAAQAFAMATKAKCGSATEEDFGAFMTQKYGVY